MNICTNYWVEICEPASYAVSPASIKQRQLILGQLHKYFLPYTAIDKLEPMIEADIFIQGPIPATLVGELIQTQQVETNIGGHSIFLGQIRSDEVNGKKVKAIDYSAYESMAISVVHSIQVAMVKKYDLKSIQVRHSIGRVAVGEICLVVFTAAKHRKSAINACEEAVERIKAEVPVWGQELFEDESYQWKVNN